MAIASIILGAGLLPFTGNAAEQLAPTQTAPDGTSTYATRCASCHGTQLEGRTGPPLIGPAVAGRDAQELAEVIQTTMPLSSPGSLTADDSLMLANYLLSRNTAKKLPR